MSLSMVTEGIALSGVATFMPKMIENKFQASASWAAVLSGKSCIFFSFSFALELMLIIIIQMQNATLSYSDMMALSVRPLAQHSAIMLKI